MIRSTPIHDGQVAADIAIALNRGRDSKSQFASVVWDGMGHDDQIIGEWRLPVVMVARDNKMFVIRIEEMEGPFGGTFEATLPPGMCDHAEFRPTCGCPK